MSRWYHYAWTIAPLDPGAVYGIIKVANSFGGHRVEFAKLIITDAEELAKHGVKLLKAFKIPREEDTR